MATISQIRTKHCPFCDEKHIVEYVGTCLIKFLDNSKLNIYKCPKHNKEFRIQEKQ